MVNILFGLLGCIMVYLMSNKRNIVAYITFVCLQFVFVTYLLLHTDIQHVAVEYLDRNAAEYELYFEKSGNNINQTSVETFIQSKWMSYRNEWKGEELLSMSGLTVNFSPKYWETMEMKGTHWLTDSYPEFKQRYQQMEKYCNIRRNNNNTVNSIITTGRRLIFVDKYELLGCSVPKASSSTMSLIYTKLDQGLVGSQRHAGYTGSRLNISISNNLDDIHQNVKRIQTYLKIILTRHPFSWLGSKYHFTIDNSASKAFQEENCPAIIKILYLKGLPTNEKTFIKKYKEKMSETDFQEKLFQIRRYNSGPGKYSVSLFEYIQSLIQKKEFETQDHYFSGQSFICNPCAMHYDVILQCTNGYEEINRVLDFLQRDKPSNKRLYYPKESPIVSRQKCNEEFSTIPIQIRRKLHKVYEMDFLLFGYDFQDDPNNPNACY